MLSSDSPNRIAPPQLRDVRFVRAFSCLCRGNGSLEPARGSGCSGEAGERMLITPSARCAAPLLAMATTPPCGLDRLADPAHRQSSNGPDEEMNVGWYRAANGEGHLPEPATRGLAGVAPDPDPKPDRPKEPAPTQPTPSVPTSPQPPPERAPPREPAPIEMPNQPPRPSIPNPDAARQGVVQSAR